MSTVVRQAFMISLGRLIRPWQTGYTQVILGKLHVVYRSLNNMENHTAQSYKNNNKDLEAMHMVDLRDIRISVCFGCNAKETS